MPTPDLHITATLIWYYFIYRREVRPVEAADCAGTRFTVMTGLAGVFVKGTYFLGKII